MIAALLVNWRLLLFASLLAFCGVQEVRISRAHAELDRARAEFAEEREKAAAAAARAEEEAREEELLREKRNQEIIDAANHETQLAQAAAAGAGSALVELQRKYSAFASAIRQASAYSGPAKPGEAAADPLGVLTVVLGRLGERAKVVERFADDAHIAGAACERYADGLQPGKQVP